MCYIQEGGPEWGEESRLIGLDRTSMIGSVTSILQYWVELGFVLRRWCLTFGVKDKLMGPLIVEDRLTCDISSAVSCRSISSPGFFLHFF